MSVVDEERLRAVYAAFNDHDLGRALALMHPEVDWPNAWEGGRVAGREAVLAYWARQLESIQSTAEPERIERQADDSVAVTAHQVVRDAKTDAVLSDAQVLHRYWFEDGLVVRMEVEEV